MVEALVRRVVAGGQPVAGQTTAVVGGGAVGEPVGHHEVEALLGQPVPQAVGGQPPVLGRDPVAAEIGRGDGRLVGGVVVDDSDLGRAGEDQRAVGVALGAVGAVALVPRVVQRDLEVPGTLREGEHRAVGGPDGILGELGLCAGRLPVRRAPELGLEAADQRRGPLGRLRGLGLRHADQTQGGDQRQGDRERQARGSVRPTGTAPRRRGTTHVELLRNDWTRTWRTRRDPRSGALVGTRFGRRTRQPRCDHRHTSTVTGEAAPWRPRR